MKNKIIFFLFSVFFIPLTAYAQESSFLDSIDKPFASIVNILAGFLFFQFEFFPVPLILIWLTCGGIFFTFKMRFFSLRGIKHAIDVTMGKYDNPADPGEVSHFQALSSALSATVGLGNIAGVAVAIGVGGPGAIFWMWISAIIGMTSKFVECTLAQTYRQRNPKTGEVRGGPMYTLSLGLKDLHPRLSIIGKILGIFFAAFTSLSALGAGNMFQANQTFEQLKISFPSLDNMEFAVGIALSILVGLVIIGGIHRIGMIASKIVPIMCGGYIIICMYIILSNITMIPDVFVTIFSSAFTNNAAFGGFLGVMIQGIRRASFSNEAGMGSSAIAHAAAKTNEPVREGAVAMLEPVIDTLFVCTMTALVVVITGMYEIPELKGKGVAMTSAAFSTVSSWFPWFLTATVFLFAYSTMISWYYYGEKAFEYLFKNSNVIIYKIIFLTFTVFGTCINLKNVLDFSDMIFLAMAFPNIFGGILLSGKVKRQLDEYWRKYKNNEFQVYK